ncbi:hypothetical protein M3_0088 [Lysinibacillus phage vB_LfM_LysYB1]|nr:hypothetical protein M3_0088 [Lysinibacillus phage vB_LfM_LysYB1]WAB25403.1 hypothetical protein M5_0225 [Lysinibacillus phage vB_LfM_LysYB2]
MNKPKNQIAKLRSLHYSLGEVLNYMDYLEDKARNSVEVWEHKRAIDRNKELEDENRLLTMQNRKLLLESIGYESNEAPQPKKEPKEIIPFDDVRKMVQQEITKGSQEFKP